MTPEEALAAALHMAEDPHLEGVSLRQHDIAEAQVAALTESGYSLVPTAELDRLRAVERAAEDVDDGWFVVDPGREQVRLRYASDLPRRLNALRAALGDRAAESGRDDG